MTTFYNRPTEEQNIIRLAYDFEIQAIENLNGDRNPWFDIIKTWKDGFQIWEALNEAVEMAYN